MFLQQKYKESKKVLSSAPIASDTPVKVEHVNLLNTIKQYPKKVVVQQNMIALDLITGNIDSAKTGLEEMTATCGVTNSNGKEMPLCLLLSWMYYYIRIGDKKMALELIKRRRYMSQMFNSKGSLLKLTH